MPWLILTSTCLGIILWHGGVSRLGLATSALDVNVAPLFGLLISVAPGFQPTAWQLLGGALVLVGAGQLSAQRWLRARRQAAGGAV